MIYIIVSIIIAVTGQLILKTGISKIGEFEITLKTLFPLIFKILSNPFILIGLIFYTIGAFTWIFGLSKVPLSLAYPLLSLGYVIVVACSAIFFHEHVSLIRWVGVLVVILGVFLLSRS
jgi:drug/metabolite transporter (DMT)-like permease